MYPQNVNCSITSVFTSGSKILLWKFLRECCFTSLSLGVIISSICLSISLASYYLRIFFLPLSLPPSLPSSFFLSFLLSFFSFFPSSLLFFLPSSLPPLCLSLSFFLSFSFLFTLFPVICLSVYIPTYLSFCLSVYLSIIYFKKKTYQAPLGLDGDYWNVWPKRKWQKEVNQADVPT